MALQKLKRKEKIESSITEDRIELNLIKDIDEAVGEDELKERIDRYSTFEKAKAEKKRNKIQKAGTIIKAVEVTLAVVIFITSIVFSVLSIPFKRIGNR